MDISDSIYVVDREVRWQVPFVSLDNKKYRVDIYQEEYRGTAETLKGAVTPFYTQEDDDEDAFLPIRTSSGYLTIIVENQSLVDEIIAHDEHDRYVELVDATDALNEVCVWNGFVAPDQYSGTWDRTPYELQLPLLSPLEAAKATRYMPTSRMQNVATLLERLYGMYVETEPEYAWFAVLDESETPPAMVPFLSVVLTDNLFTPEQENNDLLPVAGNPPLPALKSSCSSAYDVLTALCKLFGYVVYETPGNLFFAAPDKTNVYRRVLWEDIKNNGYDVITLPNHQFPAITGNGHSRVLVPGRSLVRVFCNLQTIDELMTLDLHKCDYDTGAGSSGRRAGYVFPPSSGTIGKCYLEFMRLDSNYYDSRQYSNNPPAYSRQTNPINIHYTNYDENGRNYVGGNWINWIDAKYNLMPFDYNSVVDALIITTTDGSYTGNLLAGSMRSLRNYSAINLSSSLMLDFKVEFAIDSFSPEFDDALNADDWDIPMALKWGDYYYQGDGTWSTTFNIFQVTIRPVDNSYKTFAPLDPMITYEGYQIVIPRNMLEDLQGQIRLMFFTFPGDMDIVMVKITDITLSTFDRIRNSKTKVQDKYDYNLVDYRQSLSTFRLSEYKYEQFLTNHCVDYSFSGVQSDEPLTDICYEQLLVSRLAAWYDRTIEQLTVAVENEDIQPGVRIVRGNDKYIVLSRTIDWRNGQQILTIQKMYDEQPAN